MAATVMTVADEILRQAKKRGRKLTPLQLMKLTYISLGWWSALKDEKLFNERVEAWKYGPVIPDLYRATKHFGRDPIPFEMIEDQAHDLDEETVSFLADLVSKYGQMSGYALSSLTHKADTPWAKCYRDDVFGIEIPFDVIKKHYDELYSARPAAA